MEVPDRAVLRADLAAVAEVLGAAQRQLLFKVQALVRQPTADVLELVGAAERALARYALRPQTHRAAGCGRGLRLRGS
jgi:hypothetical protein